MESGAEAVRLFDDAPAPRHLLFLDADLADTAADAAPLAEPVRRGEVDMTVAVFASTVKLGGHGFVVRLSRDGIKRATGWTATQPLNGQRCLTRAAFEAARPLAPVRRRDGADHRPAAQGLPGHRGRGTAGPPATGTDWKAQLHRARQFRDVARHWPSETPPS